MEMRGVSLLSDVGVKVAREKNTCVLVWIKTATGLGKKFTGA